MTNLDIEGRVETHLQVALVIFGEHSEETLLEYRGGEGV